MKNQTVICQKKSVFLIVFGTWISFLSIDQSHACTAGITPNYNQYSTYSVPGNGAYAMTSYGNTMVSNTGYSNMGYSNTGYANTGYNTSMYPNGAMGTTNMGYSGYTGGAMNNMGYSTAGYGNMGYNTMGTGLMLNPAGNPNMLINPMAYMQTLQPYLGGVAPSYQNLTQAYMPMNSQSCIPMTGSVYPSQPYAINNTNGSIMNYGSYNTPVNNYNSIGAGTIQPYR